jgi:hypothetical protein
MPTLAYWAALFGAAWIAVAAFFATDVAMNPEVYGRLDVSFTAGLGMLVLFSVLSAIPAAFVASIIEPVVRAITPTHRVLKAMAYALAGGLAGYLTPLLVDVVRNMDAPNSHIFRRAVFCVPAGMLGGVLFFRFRGRKSARV